MRARAAAEQAAAAAVGEAAAKEAALQTIAYLAASRADMTSSDTLQASEWMPLVDPSVSKEVAVSMFRTMRTCRRTSR